MQEYRMGEGMESVSRQQLKTGIALGTELCLYKLITVTSDHIKDWLEDETLINTCSLVRFDLDLLLMDLPSILTSE